MVKTRLYVGNLSWHITEEELKHFFSQAGKVISATIILNRDTGRSRGFGFVEMETDAQTAITTFNGQYLHGRPLIVKEALPEGEKKDNINPDLLNFLIHASVGQSYSFYFGNASFTIFRDK